MKSNAALFEQLPHIMRARAFRLYATNGNEDHVFNDDNGYGYVREIRDHATGDILYIRFDTGKEMSLLGTYAKLTKIDEK